MKPLYVKKNGIVQKVSGIGMPATYPASSTSYNNTDSGLTATNVQDAIDEIFDDTTKTESSTINGNIKINGTETQVYDDSALWKSQGEYGVKNLIPFPYSDGISKVYGGVTYTVNADGSVTAVGTASTSGSFFRLSMNLVLSPGDYIMTGDMDDGTTYTPSSILFNENNSAGLAHWNYGKNTPCNFTIDETDGYILYNLRIRIANGSTVNQTFYPMIRLAADTDETYRPYALTNKQLTDLGLSVVDGKLCQTYNT